VRAAMQEAEGSVADATRVLQGCKDTLGVALAAERTEADRGAAHIGLEGCAQQGQNTGPEEYVSRRGR